MIIGKTGCGLLARSLKVLMTPLYLVLGLFVSCAPGPTQPDKYYSIVLTLDDKTNTKATFSGKPINAFCTFRDSVSYEEIAWHLGSGKIIRPLNTSYKMKALRVQLLWDIMPLRKDSLGHYFDSLYISLGGETNRSNGACVFVTNVPPVIDSIKISRRTYGAQDTVRDTVRPYDSLSTMLIRIFARDVNQNALASTWSGSGVARITGIANSINANYLLPRARVTDTLALSVYDRQGGNCDKVLYITSITYKNRPPIIDSVKVRDTLFPGSPAVSLYAAAAFDSLRFKVWAHDSDVYDNIQIKWAGRNPKQAVLRQKGADMTWACTSAICRDTLETGGARVIDTVTVTVNDMDSIGATKTIIIVKGRGALNRSPLFDSLMINDSLVKGSWTLFRWSATSKDTLRFRMFAHDPDSLDTAHFTIKAGDSLRIANASDTAVVYLCKDTLVRDTLSFFLSDRRGGSVLKQVIVDVNNRFPAIDSVLCGDSLYRSDTTIFSHPAAGLDTLSIRLFAHDSDSGDVLKDTAYSSSATQVTRLSAMKFQFVCPDSTYSDTLTAVVSDAKLKPSSKRLVIDITKR